MAGPRHLHLIGKTYGRLTVTALIGQHPTRSVMVWECKCSCGADGVLKMTDQLRQGKSPSCGCWSKENRIAGLRKKLLIHGMAQTLTGISWQRMLDRCFKSSHPAYHRYGGRGILPCEFLRTSPVNLLALIGDRQSQAFSLDRINNNGGYWCGSCAQCLTMRWPLNVRWSTIKEQTRNTSRTVLYRIAGIEKCGAEWAESFGISRTKFGRRYKACRVTKGGTKHYG